MEKRKNAVKHLNRCRFCLSSDSSLSSIYDKNRSPKSSVTLPLQILSCVSFEVFPSDGMPSVICDCCRFFMDVCYRYKQICRSSDEAIMQHIQAGDSLDPISWPLKLKRIFKQVNQSSKRTLVSETGATVQVTATNFPSDSEEENENVYNIKFEDGSKSQAASIKLIKSTNDDSKDQDKQENSNVFMCKICDKAFTSQRNYTRHIRFKHKDHKTVRGPFGQIETFRCDECSEEFDNQDELIYHSAKHATENLTCPLCQEKFNQVEEVSTHIKTHVEGSEFMCDLCELVFTSKLKLDRHLVQRHEDELRQEQEIDEDSMPMEEDEEGEVSNINVTEENGEMIVEITKPDDFLIDEDKSPDDSNLNATNSEESETEVSFREIPAMSAAKKPERPPPAAAPPAVPSRLETPSILKKAEEVKKQPPKVIVNEAKPSKVETKPSAPAPAPATADKSLRLLEKELQDLQRTNSRSSEAPRAPAAKPELRGRRPQLHTSTPKPKVAEEKRAQPVAKTPVVEKKVPEKRTIPTKENKEPKETKNSTPAKEEKEKDTPKSVKNASERNTTDDTVRRSSRTSKITDYAKIVKPTMSDDSDDEKDEEYKETERTPKAKKAGKSPPPPSPAAPPSQRKRGRPRKDQKAEVPAKVSKPTKVDQPEKPEEKETKEEEKKNPPAEIKEQKTEDDTKTNNDTKPSGVLVSPTGQALKKVPVKSLPPGVKALPLPLNRPSSGEVCEMQIGKKMVKVQKIVMTKAEVEAMAKKGLVEMKDGTMVLKQGIKLPTADVAALKSTLVSGGGDEAKSESPKKPMPTRVDSAS